MQDNQTRKLAFVSTHPIQYKVPIYRHLASRPGLAIEVVFENGLGSTYPADLGFGGAMKWDLPLTDGYPNLILNELGPEKTRKGRYRISTAYRLYLFLKQHSFDAIHICGYSSLIDRLAIIYAVCLGIPILFHPEGNDSNRKRRPGFDFLRAFLLKNLYRRLYRYCSIGTKSLEHFFAHGGQAHQVIDTPYCVDNDFFRWQEASLPSKNQLREKHGFRGSDFIFLFCAKLIDRKDPLTLIKAFIEVAKNRPTAHLVFVGDGPLRADMMEAIPIELKEKVRLEGFKNQTEISAYYKLSDILILPSKFEMWGLVVNEGMNFGLPAIVSEGVGCREGLIREGVSGYSFPIGDSPSLSKLMDSFIKNPSLTSAMSLSSRELIQNFSIVRTADAIRLEAEKIVRI